MHTQPIKSDTGRGSYAVTLGPAGIPVACTCPDHRLRGRKTCKHMRRAALIPAFKEARERLIVEHGWTPARVLAFFEHHKAAEGATYAIRKVIDTANAIH